MLGWKEKKSFTLNIKIQFLKPHNFKSHYEIQLNEIINLKKVASSVEITMSATLMLNVLLSVALQQFWALIETQ